MKKIAAAAFFTGLLAVSNLAWTAEDAASRTVTVSGEAEVNVIPDEVTITLGVEARNKLLPEVKRLSGRSRFCGNTFAMLL